MGVDSPTSLMASMENGAGLLGVGWLQSPQFSDEQMAHGGYARKNHKSQSSRAQETSSSTPCLPWRGGLGPPTPQLSLREPQGDSPR